MKTRKRILIVDDEPYIVTLLATRLASSGYDTLSAADGQRALPMAKEERPDLIILDLMLPKMDGYRVCALLKKDARFAHIPVILFTARAQDQDRLMGAEVGAEAYITKPFDPQTMMTKIQELLGNYEDAKTKEIPG